jgi:hypothetical protein
MRLIGEVMPSSKLTLTLALVEILRIMLEQGEPAYVKTLWRNDEIMEELRSNLSIEKDLTINILEVYYLLIAHDHYD